MIDKHELIDKIEKLDKVYSDRLYIEKDEVLALVKQLNAPEKVKIPQFVAEWLERVGGKLFGLNYDMVPSEIYEWVYEGENCKKLHLACAIGYEVQKEKRYVVTDGNHLYFKEYQEDVEIVILVDEMPGTMDYVKKFDTKEEAQEAANILGWKVREVE